MLTSRQILGAAFVLTLVLAAWTAWRDSTVTNDVVSPAVRAGSASLQRAGGGSTVIATDRSTASMSSDELARDPLIESGSDAFKAVSFLPPPPEAPPPPPVAPAPKPTAPPFPYKYFGKMTGTDGKPITYLTRGDEVIPVHKQEILDNTYRIDAISDTAITVTYLPLNAMSDVPIQTAAQ